MNTTPEQLGADLEALLPSWSDAHVAELCEVLSRELLRRRASGPGALFAAAMELRHRERFARVGQQLPVFYGRPPAPIFGADCEL